MTSPPPELRTPSTPPADADADALAADALARRAHIASELRAEMFRRSRAAIPTLLTTLLILRLTAGEVFDALADVRAAMYAIAALVVLRFALISLPARYWPAASARLGQRVAFVSATLLTSALMAWVDYRVYPRVEPIRGCVVLMLNAGILAGALASLSSSLGTYAGYVAMPALTLGALMLTDRRPWPARPLALTWVIWIGLLVFQALDYYRSRRRGIELRLAVDATNRELAAANQRLVESNVRADRIFSALAQALPGKVLDGKFMLDERIGEGGFAVVFRATHLALQRSVAVKIFRPQAGNDSAAALERFRLEGIAVSRLEHPGIVRVFDSGVSHEGIAYIVMELLEGETLAAALAGGVTLPLERAAEVAMAVCDALAAAHEQGVVHRDVKPENVFLHRAAAGDEVVKLVDFGIAKSTDLDGGTSLTRTGAVVGTPAFMAPERLRGRESDASSDVYGVGAVLYRMVSGCLPYEGTLSELLIESATHAPVALRALDPDVPEVFSDVVDRALARERRRRPTATELRAMIRDALAALPADVRARRYVGRRRERAHQGADE